VAKEAEKVVILTGRVELVAHRVGAEETTHHQRSRSAGFDLSSSGKSRFIEAERGSSDAPPFSYERAGGNNKTLCG